MPAAASELNPYAAPAPQEKVITAGASDVLSHQIIDMGDILTISWRVCSEDLGQCAIMGLIYLALTIGVGVIGAMLAGIAQAVAGDSIAVVITAQIFNQLLSFGVNTWVLLGMAAWGLKMLRTRQSNINEFFSVGPYFLRALGATLLLYLMIGAITGVFVGIPVLAGWAAGSQEIMVIGGIVGGVVAVIAMLYIVYTFFLYYFFIVDRNAGVTEAFRLSAEFTRGNRLSIFAVTLIVGVAGAVFSVCTCYLGFIIYIPFMMLVLSMIYLMATGQPHAAFVPAPLKQI